VSHDSKKDDGKSKSERIDQGLIRDLASLLRETDLSEIEVEHEGLRLRVSRQITAAPVYAQAPAPYPQDFAMTQAQPAPKAADPAPAADDLSNNPGVLRSPMVGTAYLAPEPGAPNFVREGDKVSKGQTICIVEAMKVFNPIQAHKAGTVTKILVENAQPVEFDEPLVLID